MLWWGGWRRADQRVAPAACSGGGGQGDVVWRVAAPVGVDEAAAALAGVDQAFDLWRARRGGTSLRVFRNDGGDLMTSH